MSKPIYEVGQTYKMRSGLEVLIVADNLGAANELLGTYTKHGVKYFGTWTPDGAWADGAWAESSSSSYDLLPPEPKKITRWVNIYKNAATREICTVSRLFKTEGEAEQNCARPFARVQITFYEGEGL